MKHQEESKRQLTLDLTGAPMQVDRPEQYRKNMAETEVRLQSGKEEFTGWVTLPFQYDRKELEQVLAAAEEIKSKCNTLIVIGIGGSYLGARACIHALQDPKEVRAGKVPEILFAGNNISGTYHAELLDHIAEKEVCLCVISKSGTTAEPSIAFAILKEALYQKYGKEEARKRIYAITDRSKGILRQEADQEGYTTFIVPDDIGGRYSVLSPVGLLPIAAAGIEVRAMLAGAASLPYQADSENLTHDYALARYLLSESGKTIEIFEYYEPGLQYFAEWLKQLFGESEGKEGKGIFPASLQFSADLHSMGQFLQDGNQIFFETVMHVTKPPRDLVVPNTAEAWLAGKSMNQVNEAAVLGVINAHKKAHVPIIKIDIPELTAYYVGQMIYFFEKTCALTANLMGVNPFDQPGVEFYKAEMRQVLQSN